MTEVIIAGIGQTPVGEHWDTSLRELAFQAIEAAQVDARGLAPQMLVVGNMLAPNLSNQAHLEEVSHKAGEYVTMRTGATDIIINELSRQINSGLIS